MLLMFAPVIAVMLLLQVFASRSQQKTEQNRLKKLRELKKNDPIVTLSGIYGTFISITEDGREVTMKVDENCRLRVRSESIRELPVASPKT